MPTIPSPKLALRIGIVGNRDLPKTKTGQIKQTLTRLLKDLDQSVKDIYSEYSELSGLGLYDNKEPKFYLINSLAEGADQLAAEVALEAIDNINLICPIPFKKKTYLSNFKSENNQTQFDQLLSNATNPLIIELDFDLSQKKQGFRAAADTLLDNSDILIAIFDDDKDSGLGGSANTVNLAIQQGLPVFHMDTKQPETCFLVQFDNKPAVASINITKKCVEQILLPTALQTPKTDNSKKSPLIPNFYKQPLITETGLKFIFSHPVYCFYALVWKLLYGFLKLIKPNPLSKSSDQKTTTNQTYYQHGELIDNLQAPFKSPLQHMDKLAGFYMDLYRGAFILNFILGAFAVLAAVMSYFGDQNTAWAWSIAELVCLIIILCGYLLNRYCKWQKKAVDFRFMAEYFRHAEMLALLGCNASLLKTAAHKHSHDPGKSWIGWYLNAVNRATPPFLGYFKTKNNDRNNQVNTVKLESNYLQSVKKTLCEKWLQDQHDYHVSLHKRYAAWEGFADFLMFVLFVATLAGVIMHLIHYDPFIHPETWHEHFALAFMVTVFPAFLGAIHGITVQGEFERLSQRSEDTAEQLSKIIIQLNTVTAANNEYFSEAKAISKLAMVAAQIMLEEVTDWQVLYRSHDVPVT